MLSNSQVFRFVFTLSTHADKHYHMLSKTLIFTNRKICNQRSRGLYKGCNGALVKVGKSGKIGLKTIEKQRSNKGQV